MPPLRCWVILIGFASAVPPRWTGGSTVLGILTLLKIVQPRVRDMFQHPAAL